MTASPEPAAAADAGSAGASTIGTTVGSLRRRLVIAAIGFITLALVAAGLVIGAVLYRFVTAQVEQRLDAQLLSLAATLVVARDGALSLSRDVDGPPFDRALSGWYWQVRSRDDLLVSRSLSGSVLALGALADAPAPAATPQSIDGTGPRGERLRVRTRTIVPADASQPVTLAAAGPAAQVQDAFASTLRTLVVTLAILGLALVAAVVLQVRLGLVPLQRLAAGLAAVRDGRLDRIPGDQPVEVAPLVDEVNALLAHNERSLQQARAHVANLAHGLKTPLATLSLALQARDPPDAELLRVVDGMDRQVRHHLRRARSAALGESPRVRAELGRHATDIVLVMRRLHAGRSLAIDDAIPAGLVVACDPQDLDEMLGNLVDNACRWARARVALRAGVDGHWVRIDIDDDGPGLAPEAIARVLRRGERLDESAPGSGFGLPIAGELAVLYGGTLELGRAALGGLAVSLRLPRASRGVDSHATPRPGRA